MVTTTVSKYLKKPIHLYSKPSKIRHADPIEGFFREELTLISEMDFGEIAFDLTAIIPESERVCDLVIIKDKAFQDPSSDIIYILVDYESAVEKIRVELPNVKRLSKAGYEAIIFWINERIKEYAKSLFSDSM